MAIRLQAGSPLVPAFAACAAAAALLSAWIAQYGFNLAPCVLCIYQRYAHGAALALALLALLLPRARTPLVFLAALAFLAGAGTAFFHVGVEEAWWRGSEACSGPGLAPGASLEEMQRALLATPVVRCDQVPWSFLGLSMAGYNFLYSLVLAALLAFAGLRGREADHARA